VTPYYQDEAVTILNLDCREAMRGMDAESVDAIVTDPPYGLEFMGKEWDSFGGDHGWKTGAGFSKPGIGDRNTAWPSFTGASDEFGGANPTCATCGGRARGKKKCGCENPDWRVKGEKPDRMYGRRRQMMAFQESMQCVFEDALRVAKPGAHLLAFGGTRTFHRLACAIEDAGWEIRDVIMWVYGSGFPKSLDVSKAIDKAAGVKFFAVPANGVGFMNSEGEGGYNVTKNQLIRKGESTDDARTWQGWGTALKPAWEPIIVARKPIEGTVAANVMKYGTGAINVDGCRVHGGASDGGSVSGATALGQGSGWNAHENRETEIDRSMAQGRWPANLVHDGSDEVLELFPVTGSSKAAPRGGTNPNPMDWGNSRADGDVCKGHDDNGGSAARFFYCAKASKSDRDEGCEGLDARESIRFGE
jgi:site-specific DNA-methyltransferase (adenine-specific)